MLFHLTWGTKMGKSSLSGSGGVKKGVVNPGDFVEVLIRRQKEYYKILSTLQLKDPFFEIAIRPYLPGKCGQPPSDNELAELDAMFSLNFKTWHNNLHFYQKFLKDRTISI